jgi:hypothetical protein
MNCTVEEMQDAEPVTRILHGLHMGSMRSTSEPQRYDLIVSTAEEWRPPRARGVTRMHIPLADVAWDFYNHPQELQQLADTAETIAESVDAGRQVLIFCNMGMNRSGLLTGLTLMHLGYTPRRAINAIRKRHPCTLSNMSFVEALKFARSERMA